MSAQQASNWQHQDGLPVVHDTGCAQSYPQHRWNMRCPDGWEGYPVRVAWREAEPVPIVEVTHKSRRYHSPSGMLLVADSGFLTTCFPADERDLSVNQNPNENNEY